MTTASSARSTRRRLRIGLYVLTLSLALSVVAGPLTGTIAEAIDPPSAVVTGSVFDDRNRNDTRDAGEPGVAGVAVSDGTAIVRTGPDGHYTLEISTERRAEDMVFITQPAGWSVGTDESMTPRHYRLLGRLADAARPTADFALTADAGSTTESFTFANIADPHVNPQLGGQVEEINSTKQPLEFVAISGDLTNNATDAEFRAYRAASARSKLPVWPAVGNHEYYAGGGSGYAARIDNYRRHVGPEWYSFDYGNRHYIVLENNGSAPFDEQLAWATQDLAMHATGKRVVVLAHQPMNVPFGSPSQYDQYGDLLARYDTELVLVGHEHSNDVEPNSQFLPKATHIQTVSSSYTIDNAPRGFRYVHMSGAHVDNPFRMYGREKQLTIVNPTDGSTLPLVEKQDLIANVYDTADPAVKVQARVDGSRWREMTSTGGEFTWRLPIQVRDGLRRYPASGALIPSGRHTLEVRATDAAGQSWSATSTFTIDRTKRPVAPSSGRPWAQHHGDAAHTGVAAQPVAAGQRLAWAYSTPGVFLTGSPTIVGDTVYAATRDENGEGHWAVHAVDLATGRAKWTHKVDSSVHGSIAVHEGKVFAASLRGILYALDARTGAELWRKQPEVAPEPYNQRVYGYYGVTVADGKLLWPLQTRYGKASSGLLTALEPGNGTVLWESRLAGSTMSDGTPAVSDGKVFIGAQTADKTLAFSLADGKRLWESGTALGGWQDGIPTAAGGRVFIGSGNGIVARDARTGATLWTFRSPHDSQVSSNATPSAPAVDGDVVYMGFPSGAVTALDARSGAVLWDRPLGGSTYEGGVISSPAVAGRSLFVGSNNGSMYALDKRTGQPLWQQKIGTWVSAGPAVSGNTVVAGAYDGNLYAWTPDGTAATPWAAATGVVKDSATGTAVDGVRVTLVGADGKVVGTTYTVSDGDWAIAAPAGRYTVQVAKRGTVAGDPVAVTLGDTGEVTVTATVRVVDAPVAGMSTVAPDYGAGTTRPDVVPGDEHAYVMNKAVTATVVKRTGPNNQPGTFRPGWPADIFRNDSTGMETLDWSELVLTRERIDAKPWDRSGQWLDLPEVSASGAAVTASGSAQIDPAIKSSVTYETLPGAPVVKMTLDLRNTSVTDFTGHFQYIIDPDSSSDVAIIPGVPGTNIGYRSSGWTGNYLYVGATSPNGQPAHGLAWADDQPAMVHAGGYIGSLAFDASVAAGATKQLTWYHITDYPAAGDPTTRIANWAALIPGLDPDATDRPVVRGTVTDEAGDPMAGHRVEVLDGTGTVVATASTLEDGTYLVAVPAGEVTVRAGGLGYADVSRTVTVAPGAPTVVDLTLRPLAVGAGTGMPLTSGLVEGGPSDIVLFNQKLAMSIAAGGNDPQLDGSTIGKVRDWAVAGEADQIDWLNLPYVTATEPLGTEAWQQLQVRSTHVEVLEQSPSRAVVRVTGTSAEHPRVQVVTDYVVQPDQEWVTATTVYRNTGGEALSVWVGDALDHDGAGQHTLVAGRGAVTTPYGEPAAYTPTGRWIGMAGTDPQVYGLIYGGSDSFQAYGNGNWIMSKFKVDLPAGGSYRLERRLAVAWAPTRSPHWSGSPAEPTGTETAAPAGGGRRPGQVAGSLSCSRTARRIVNARRCPTTTTPTQPIPSSQPLTTSVSQWCPRKTRERPMESTKRAPTRVTATRLQREVLRSRSR